jgi:hypothetical protein
MAENPYQSPRPVASSVDKEAIHKAEGFPFRCAFGGASIGSAAGALGAVLLKLIACGFALADAEAPPLTGYATTLLAELVVELISGTLVGILAGCVVGGALGAAALFWPSRWLALFGWFSAAVAMIVGVLLGYAFGSLSTADQGLGLGPIPIPGLCTGAILGLLAGTLLGRGIRRRLDRDFRQP